MLQCYLSGVLVAVSLGWISNPKMKKMSAMCSIPGEAEEYPIRNAIGIPISTHHDAHDFEDDAKPRTPEITEYESSEEGTMKL